MKHRRSTDAVVNEAQDLCQVRSPMLANALFCAVSNVKIGWDHGDVTDFYSLSDLTIWSNELEDAPISTHDRSRDCNSSQSIFYTCETMSKSLDREKFVGSVALVAQNMVFAGPLPQTSRTQSFDCDCRWAIEQDRMLRGHETSYEVVMAQLKVPSIPAGFFGTGANYKHDDRRGRVCR